MSEEWGPWIEHGGGDCPCVGQLAQVVYTDGDVSTGIAEDNVFWAYVVRYRLIRPSLA